MGKREEIVEKVRGTLLLGGSVKDPGFAQRPRPSLGPCSSVGISRPKTNKTDRLEIDRKFEKIEKNVVRVLESL